MNQLWSKKGRKRSQEQLQVSSKETPFSERALFVAGCRDPSRALQASLLHYGGDGAETDRKGRKQKILTEVGCPAGILVLTRIDSIWKIEEQKDIF